jgi:hypothetical protein
MSTPLVIPPVVDRHSRLVTIMREEGPTALYKGFIPKVLRLAPGGGVLLLVVEFTLGVFRNGSFPFLSHTAIHLTFSPFSLTALGPPYI